MCLRRLAWFGKLWWVHIGINLGITWASPPHLVVPGQARYGSVRFIHIAVYSVSFCAVSGLKGSVNRV